MENYKAERKRKQRLFGRLYKRSNDSGDYCVYCGDLRNVLDHVPPLQWVETIDLKKFRKSGGKLLLYPCCHQCNSMLGNKPLFYFDERIKYLNQAYLKEINKIESLWSESEIKEMSYMFQVMIRAKMDKAKTMIRKLHAIEETIYKLEQDGII